MNIESQRMAIAEACPSVFKIESGTFHKNAIYWNIDGETGQAVNPLSDLNAMHEAEKTSIMGTEFEDTYYCSLADDFGDGHGCTWHNGMSATAPQRAEAFLRTLNLWEDSK